MRKLFVLVLLLAGFQSRAQNAHESEDPIVVLGDIRPVLINGREGYPTLTLREIMENPPAVKNIPGYKVSRFAFTIYTSDNLEIHGPYYSKNGQYTEEMKKMVSTYAYGLGTIYIDDILLLRPDGRTQNARMLEVNFR